MSLSDIQREYQAKRLQEITAELFAQELAKKPRKVKRPKPDPAGLPADQQHAMLMASQYANARMHGVAGWSSESYPLGYVKPHE